MTTAAGLFALQFAWYYGPFIADGQSGSLSAIVFDLRGIAFAGWTLLAFSIGALAGMLIRRVVPAIVATMVTYTGLALVAGVFLRPHYLTPLVTSDQNTPASAWIMSQWWTNHGTLAFTGRPPMDLIQQYCPPSVLGPNKPSPGAIAGCLAPHGYTEWTRYQPASRFWPFQFIENGWLLALSALLIGITVWLVRRRAA